MFRTWTKKKRVVSVSGFLCIWTFYIFVNLYCCILNIHIMLHKCEINGNNLLLKEGRHWFMPRIFVERETQKSSFSFWTWVHHSICLKTVFFFSLISLSLVVEVVVAMLSVVVVFCNVCGERGDDNLVSNAILNIFEANIDSKYDVGKVSASKNLKLWELIALKWHSLLTRWKKPTEMTFSFIEIVNSLFPATVQIFIFTFTLMVFTQSSSPEQNPRKIKRDN